MIGGSQIPGTGYSFQLKSKTVKGCDGNWQQEIGNRIPLESKFGAEDVLVSAA